MKRPRLPLPPHPALYAVTAAIQGPWTLHGIARHLYPQLKEELQKQGYPESTPLSLYWWMGWLLAMGIGNMLGESHAFAAALLYILCGLVQLLLYFLIRLQYPHGLPHIKPTYRHYKLNEWLEVWLPATVGLPLLLLTAGCGISTCMATAGIVIAVALLLTFRPLRRH